MLQLKQNDLNKDRSYIDTLGLCGVGLGHIILVAYRAFELTTKSVLSFGRRAVILRERVNWFPQTVLPHIANLSFPGNIHMKYFMGPSKQNKTLYADQNSCHGDIEPYSNQPCFKIYSEMTKRSKNEGRSDGCEQNLYKYLYVYIQTN